MHTPKRALLAWLAAALACLVVSPVIAADPVVTVDPWGPVTIVVFDPDKPPGAAADPAKPGDLPGPPADPDGRSIIPANERAVAVAEPAYEFTVRTTGPDAAHQTIAAVTVTLSGKTTIYLPKDADQQLKDHESAHDALAKIEYDQASRQKIAEAVKGLVGSTFGSFEEAHAAVDQAIDRHGLQALRRQIDLIGSKFDRLTNHGRNDQVDPATGKVIDTPTGVAMTLAERARASAPGAAPMRPDAARALGATAPDPARAFFDPATDRLGVGGDLLLSYTNVLPDPIVGRGLVQVEPMIVIGLADNGAIHLSDTQLRIKDTLTGDFVLDGYLLNAAYMPSSLPGFAGMIQAYLDIPPDFAGGLDNAMASAFLAGIGAARDGDDLPTFWFYADQPLFDPAGRPLVGTEGVTGALKIGAGVPEPATWALMLAGLGAAGLIGRRRLSRSGIRRWCR